jgi:hypothetical protein
MEALAHPIANASFALIANRNSPDVQHVRGFAVFEGHQQMWIMVPQKNNSKQQDIEFLPADPHQVERRFLEILP